MNTNPATTTKPTPFRVDSSSENMFYNSKDLQEYDPVFYYGCKTKPRKIVVKKNIPVADYLFANLKKGEWNISSDDCKKSQLLISRAWVDANMKSMFESRADQPEHEPATSCTADYEEAPSVLELEDAEKFRDADGNIVEIETRGERNRNKIFFKVKDVMTAFSMPSLDHTLRDTTSNYERGLHYNVFFVLNTFNLYSKQMYLTYFGFLKVVYSSFNIRFFNKNQNMLTKWLDNIINNKCSGKFLLESVIPDTCGVIYIVTSPIIDAVKIGYWTGEIPSLISRYKMILGSELQIHYKRVENARISETNILYYFQSYNLSGELFAKKHLHLYIEYLQTHITEYFSIIDKESYHQHFNDTEENGLFSRNELEKEPVLLFFQYKIKDLEHELANIKLDHNLAMQKEQYEKQFLQFQLDNAIQFASLKEEKYLLQIQLLQQNK
jgi:hypothetical protein